MPAPLPLTLIAIISPALLTHMGGILSKTSPSLFSHIVLGNTLSDFSAELAKTSPDRYVFAFGDPAATDIFHAFHSQRLAPHGATVAWVHSLFAGVDAFDPPRLAQLLHAPLSNARGPYAPLLAEHVLLSCLYFHKQVVRLQYHRRHKLWERFTNEEMRGSTLGVIGYGNIGRAVAKVVAPLGMRVLGYRRSPVPSPDDLGVEQLHGEAGLNQVLEESDFVVVVLPHTKHTVNFLRAEHFERMKKSAVLVNIGRGSTVHEGDLVEALQTGQIRGAALDVFEPEPLPESSPVWDLPDDKLLMTFHNADLGKKAFEEAAEQFVQLAQTYVESGKLPEYLVDLSKGY